MGWDLLKLRNDLADATAARIRAEQEQGLADDEVQICHALLARCHKVLWSIDRAVYECPICGCATNMEMHQRGCELAALLREIPQ